jgi:hypothetical protein
VSSTLSKRMRAIAASLVVMAFAPALYAAGAPPDFSGVWTWNREPGQAGRASSDTAASWPKEPPFTKEAKDKVGAYKALVTPSGATPGGFCVGYGMPSAMIGSGGYPMEIIQRPEQITVIYEAHTEIRRIYINGKIEPRDIIPSRDGTSIGHWEGDSLVVETTGLKEAVDQSSAHSEDAKIVERYRLGRDEKGRKLLTAEMTLTDPRFYTKPVSVTKKWLAGESLRMMPYDCTEPSWEDHLEKLRKEAAAK